MTGRSHWVFLTFTLASALACFAAPVKATSVTVGISGTGAVRFTDASALTCDAAAEGSIRYVDASNRVEFCDDTVWTVLGPGGVGTIYVNDLADAVTDYVTDHNMRIGSNTAMTAGAAQNLFIGESAGTAGTTNAADFNIAIAYKALDALTTAASNLAIGVAALSAAPTPSENLAIGPGALAAANGGNSNVAVGMNAIGSSGGGQYNTAVGVSALKALDNFGGDRNSALGRNAGQGLTDGNNNVLSGDNAFYSSGSGYQNVVLGSQALYNASSSNNNVAIGFSVGGTLTTGDSNILIGQSVDVPANTTTIYLTIGNLIFATGGFGTDTTIGAGNVGIADSSPSTRLEVSGGFTITPAATVNLTADNQLVTVGNNSFIRVSSNNATPANRTFCLSAGAATGQHLIIEQIGSGFQAELEDSATPACAGDSPQSLTAAMTFNSLDDTISLIWNGTSWLELGRANN